MKVILLQDGSFRVEIEGGLNGKSPEISFGVSSHGGMQKPAVTLSEDDFHLLAVRILPHLKIERLFADNLGGANHTNTKAALRKLYKELPQ